MKAKVEASLTLALLQKVREAKARGADIASFVAGEPDFPTPQLICEAAAASLRAGNTHYVATQGVESLRRAVAEDYASRLGAAWVRPEHVLISAGAKQGIYLALAALIDSPDEEILVPKPYWVSYPDVIKAANGRCRFLETQESEGFFPTVAELEAAWNPKVKGLIFASPSNPTGCMIDGEKLRALTAWCVKRKVTLLYDELYERLVLGQRAHVCPLKFVNESEAQYVISINACSKTLAMTGWRLGYLVTSRANIDALSPLQGQMLTSLPGFLQEGAAEGLRRTQEFLPGFIAIFKRRLELMKQGFAKIPQLRLLEPQGAFYVCADVSRVLKSKGLRDDYAFAEALFNEKQVAVLPGKSMGMPGWVRLSFAASEAEIAKGLERLREYCA